MRDSSSSKIKVRFFSIIRKMLKKDEVEILLNDNNNILRNLLFDLSKDFGSEFKAFIFGKDVKELNPSILILINEIEMNLLNGLDTILMNGDTISIFPSIHGGVYGFSLIFE